MCLLFCIIIWASTNHWFLSFWIDIPECSNGQARCLQECTETPGSYECRCYDGYSLDDNGYSCNGKTCTELICVYVCDVIVICSSLYVLCVAICQSGCLHGDCNAPETCTCYWGWTGFTCNTGVSANFICLFQYIESC